MKMDGLKTYCSAHSLLGRFIGVLLASETQLFFPQAKFMILPVCLNSLGPPGVQPTQSFQA